MLHEDLHKKIYRTLILLFFLITLPALIFFANNQKLTYKNKAAETVTKSERKFQGYIVEFKEEPLVVYKKRIEGKVSAQSVQDYQKNILIPKHEEAKKDILSRFENKTTSYNNSKQIVLGINEFFPSTTPTLETIINPTTISATISLLPSITIKPTLLPTSIVIPSDLVSLIPTQSVNTPTLTILPTAIFKSTKKTPPPRLTGEYTNVFNGIALDADAQQIEEIKKSIYVKNIYPNLEVKASLYDSVPLINADTVWANKDSSGKNITGDGVKVAVLDTGVDYTHPDLGQTPIAERPFETINNPIVSNLYGSLQTEIDQTFVINNNRLAYLSGNNIYVYSFTDKGTTKIDLYYADLNVIRLDLKNDILAYFASKADQSEIGLYYYDLTTKEHKKILNIPSGNVEIGSVRITENKKIVYGTTTIFIYNIANNTSTQVFHLSSDVDRAVVNFSTSGNLVAIPFSSYGMCYDQAVIYNTTTSARRDIYPPNIGPILDFKDNKIIYVGCNKNDFDPTWKTYYVYNIDDGTYQTLTYNSSGTTQSNQNLYASENKVKLTSIVTHSWMSKGAIDDGIYYFTEGISSNKIVGLDINKNRYIKINLLIDSGPINASGNKICFLAKDLRIYCHDYNPIDPYPLPSRIFNDKVIDGYDFVNMDADPYDDHGHGTHVSSIIAGNGILKGVAPGVKLISYKVLDAYGSGSTSNIMAAIEKSVQTRLDSDPNNDISVINMSLGADCHSQYNQDCGPDDSRSQAVDNAVDAGISVVVAAGNSGPGASTINSPGTARKAITVGAVTKTKQMADFSSRGPTLNSINKPDIVAPGVAICAAEYGSYHSSSRCLDDKHIAISGTSMATPHVAGLVALVKQVYPNWSPNQTKSQIVNNARSLGIDINSQGAGLVDGAQTLGFVQPSRTPTPTLTPTPIIRSAFRKAVSFDGQTGYLKVLSGKGLPDLTANFTIEMWVKSNNTSNSLSEYLMSRKSQDSIAYEYIFSLDSQYGFHMFSLPGIGSVVSQTASKLNETEWTHFAVVKDGLTLKLFINGKLKGQGYLPSYPNKNSEMPLVIGAGLLTSGVAERFYSGELDELRISKISRYNNDFQPSTGPFIPDSNTLALWHFDGNLYDSIYSQDAQSYGNVAFIDVDQTSVPTNTLPTPTPRKLCAQVITSARNSVTNECRDFPNPCVVPTGWTRVDSCVVTPSPLQAAQISPTQKISSCSTLQRKIQLAFLTSCGSPKYDKAADINKNGAINGADMSKIISVSKGFTDENICSNYLNDPKDPCKK